MSNNHSSYLPYIDGLRALSIIAIIGFHLDLSAFKGGFIGVDIFFVLSGYLITNHIYNDLHNGSFTLSGFYARRIKRIFPALFVMLTLTTLLAIIALSPSEFSDFLQGVRYSGGQISNFLFYQDVDYLASEKKINPLLHTWSLGVEEQFYLIWPLFFIGLYKCRLKPLWPLFLTIFISFIVGLVLLQTDPKAAFYMLPARAWELGIGGLAALAPLSTFRNKATWGTLTATLSLIALPVCVFFYSTGNFPGIKAALPCLATASLLYIARDQQTVIHKILSFKALTFIGLISYSLYLWHWPLIAFYKSYFSGTLSFTVSITIIALSTILAWLSYRFIETPIRKSALNKWGVILAGVGCIIIAIAASNALKRHDTAAWRTTMAFEDKISAANPHYKICAREGGGHDKDNCIIGPNKDNYEVILSGDSHASHYAPAILEWAKKQGLTVRFFFRLACPVFIQSTSPMYRHEKLDDSCMKMQKEFHEILSNDKQIKYVFLATYSAHEHPDMYSSLEKIAAYKKNSYYLGRVPVFAEDPLECHVKQHLIATKIFPRKNKECLKLDKDFSNSSLGNISQTLIPHLQKLGIPYFDPAPALMEHPFDADGHFAYMDRHHLNIYGGLHLYPYLDRFIKASER